MTESAPAKLATRYEPAVLEAAVARRWEESGRNAPPAQPSGRPSFTVMIPPPNVTGVLHMGHALNNTLQDVVVRARRMQGFDTLWLPGTDHAGIATQAVVEKKLLQERKQTRQELGREAFLKEVWQWKEHHGDVILGQLRRLGSSCDWTRLKFTMDAELSRAVRVSFVRLWERKLVYRGARIVNWDCKLQTAVSDDEVEYLPQKGKLWRLRYPVENQPGRFVTVATTRPETMLGDTGVAVHPDDARYADLRGARLVLPLVGRVIPLLADDTVEASFGSGAVKVTPGHDPADYERGARFKLPIVMILNKDGTLNAEAGRFAGLTREKARETVLAELDALGLLEGEEEFVHNVPISDRSKTAIEPLVSEQWFVRMKELSAPAIAAVRDGSLRFKPERWTKVYLDWLENVHDWCISRQLWWGHRIPVWYDAEGVPAASVADLTIGSPHPQTGRPIVRQDEDVLDTWASSWLWPFATLGWPERTPDLERFYPTQFLSTARDILYLWVARMVMAGYAFADHLPEKQRCPFAVCYIHATVLDGQGRRMSKSLGNGIDPVQMIDKYGADAVRYSLMILTREGQDVKLAENRFELGQRFCNKIWNAARFVLQNLEGQAAADAPDDSLEGRWIRARLEQTVTEVTRALETYDFHDAATALYRFTWDDFCDWYLEAAKRRMRAGGDEAARVRATLGDTLSALLRLLHPFTPFLTEALWAEMPERFRAGADLLMVAPWPASDVVAPDAASLDDFSRVQDAVRALRNVQALLELPSSDKAEGLLRCENESIARLLGSQTDLIAALAKSGSLTVRAGGPKPSQNGTDVFRGGAVFVPCPAGTDLGKLRAGLQKKLERVEQGVKATEAKLANERFLANADAETVSAERERVAGLCREAETLRANLQGLGS
jgi:valyl-tRNA synthetase